MALDNEIDFDPDYSPQNPVNREAARLRGLIYDPRKEAYVDEDGCLIRDKYGQPF
jgi:hypothetical protein